MRMLSDYVLAASHLYGVVALHDFELLLRHYEKNLDDFDGYAREEGSYKNTILFQPRYLGLCTLQQLIGNTVPEVLTTMDGLFLHPSFTEDFQKEQYVYREVFSFADAQASGPGIRELPGRLTVVMVCREKDGDIRIAYQKIRNYLKEQALQLSSDLYSLSIVNVIDPNAERKYLKYIIACVEPVKSISERYRGLKITRK